MEKMFDYFIQVLPPKLPHREGELDSFYRLENEKKPLEARKILLSQKS